MWEFRPAAPGRAENPQRVAEKLFAVIPDAA